MDKRQARLRRARRGRSIISRLKAVRLCIYRTPRHIYAQVVSPDHKVLVTASTLDKSLRDSKTGNKEAAKKVGELIAARAKSLGIVDVAFDRSGFRYHGRVEALAMGAREGGMIF